MLLLVAVDRPGIALVVLCGLQQGRAQTHDDRSLDLVARWGMDSEGEALEYMRSKLIVKEDRVASQIRVIYRDRKQDRALEVLDEINEVFGKVRSEATRRSELPPVIPLQKEQGPGAPDPVPETAEP